jgi:signal peptidase II
LVVTIILLDQLSKCLAPQIGLPLSYNRGIAFGLFAEPVLVIIVGAILIILIAYYLIAYYLASSLIVKKVHHILISQYPNIFLSLPLILGGGLSNLLDRLLWGAVRDFIKIPFWPLFNLADVSISAGATLIIFSLAWPKKNERESDDLPKIPKRGWPFFPHHPLRRQKDF